MKIDERRQRRINTLYQRALRKKYTKNGKFMTNLLVADAKQMGVAASTAEAYGKAVIEQLQTKGHLK